MKKFKKIFEILIHILDKNIQSNLHGASFMQNQIKHVEIKNIVRLHVLLKRI